MLVQEAERKCGRGRVLETPVRGPVSTSRTDADIDASMPPGLKERALLNGTRQPAIPG